MPSLHMLRRVEEERKRQADKLRSAKKSISTIALLITAAASLIGLALVLFIWHELELRIDAATVGLFFLYAVFILCFVSLFIISKRYIIRYFTNAREFISTDNLTGLRDYITFQLDSEEALLKRDGKTRCIFYFDVKNFKYINDAYGYSVGDETLIHISDVLRSQSDEGDIFGRVSGDSFVLLREYKGPHDLGSFFNRLVSEICNAPVCIRHKYNLHISAGVYIIESEQNKLSVEAMVDRAILAQETVKNQSGSSYAIFTEQIRQEIHREKQIEQEMAAALENGEFEIYFQPKCDIQRGNLIVGAETLVRWNSQKMGMLYPSAFLHVLEKNGFIVEVDRYIFEQVCIYIRGRLDRKQPVVPISVNISRIDMCQADFIEFYSSVKKKYSIPDGMLQLEFTESIAYDNHELFSNMIKKLRDNGFDLSLDDFGKGNSSLNVIKDLHVDVLKLDMMFFRDCDSRERAEAVVTSIVSMAKALGMKTVAEGVETRSQVEFLRKIGCDVVQGFVFAKPMPAKEMNEYIDELPKREALLCLDNERDDFKRVSDRLWTDAAPAKYAAALQFIDDAVVTEIDLDKGIFHIENVSDTGIAPAVKEKSYDEYIKRFAFDRVYPSDREEWIEKFSSKGIRSAFYRGENSISLRFRALDAGNKQYVWYENTVQKLDAGDAAANRAIGFIRNVHMKRWMDSKGGEGQIRFIDTILDLYRSVYEINLNTLTYKRLDMQSHTVSRSGNYRDLIENTVKYIPEDERAVYLDTFSPGNLRKELAKESALIQLEHQTVVDGQTRWYSVTVIRENSVPDRFMAMMFIQDIHDKRAKELERYNKINRLKNAIASTFEDIIEINLTTDAVEMIGNKNAHRTDLPGNYTDYLNRMILTSLHPDDRERFLRTFGREALVNAMVMEGFSERIDRYRLIDSQGNYHWMRYYALKDPGSDPKSFIIYLYSKNIDNTMRELEILQEKADHDSLTGVFNRRIFEQNVKEQLAISGNKLHALMIIDIDDFKKINDRWGHMTGDETLTLLSKKIVQCFRNEDIVGRTGGDEFVVFMKDIPSAESAVRKADEICRIIRGPLGINTYEGFVTCSIGISLYGIDGHTYEDLFRKADMALYRAKERGKNRSQLYSGMAG